MRKSKYGGLALTAFGGLVFLLLSGVGVANAGITESGPPMDELFKNQTAGGGSIIPLISFKLTGDAATNLTKVGVILNASSTMTSWNELAGLGLYKESNAHPGFQINEDTLVSGAAIANPATSTLHLLQPTGGYGVPTTPTEFFIVASTSATANITANTDPDLPDAFTAELQAEYASTSAGAVGTAFLSQFKVSLERTAPIVISEVRHGVTGNTENEFIELYNTTEFPIDLSELPLALHIFGAAGGAGNKTLTYYNKIIPDFGYFLITSQSNYSGSVPADAVYDTVTGNKLVANGGLSIATSTTVANATSTKIDLLCWGTQPSANCEGADPQLADLALDSSLERKASSTASAVTMLQNGGGEHSFKGNSSDSNDNDADFVVQTTVAPQNSFSPTEFAFGGGFGGGEFNDSGGPRVLGSFPPNAATNVPTDMTFIGFDFSEPVATTTIISDTATTTVSLTASGGSNLCTSIMYNAFPASFEPQGKCFLSAALTASTGYTFQINTDVRDLTGNRLDQDSFQAGSQSYSTTFTTGAAGTTFTNATPPHVIGVSPFWGAANVPTNIKTISVVFSEEMNPSTLNSTNITLSGYSLTSETFTFSTSTGSNILLLSISTTLTANTSYTLTIGAGVKSITNINLPFADTATFTTGSVADNSAPTLSAVLPAPGATIAANTSDFMFVFDDIIDPATATTGSVTLSTGGSNLPGTVEYNPVAKEGHFIPNNLLPLGQTLTLTLVGASIKNISGVALGTDATKTWTVEAANSDTSAPSVSHINADDFHIAVTFNEPVDSADATNLSNYSITSNGTAVSLSALAGHKIVYETIYRTAHIEGLRLTASSTIVVTASNIKDRSANKMTSSSGTCTASSFGMTGGFVGPGDFSGSTFGTETNFTSAGIGFMPPVGIFAMGTFVNASTTYMFDVPISTQIPASGTIVLTFPSTADFNVCCAATSSTKNPFLNTGNADINQSGAGTIGIKTITTTANTITLTLDTATRSENSDTHDFLHFGLEDIKNPSIAKGFDTPGYSIDIKSKNVAGDLLETFTANPIFISGSVSGGATTTIQGTVSGNGGNLQGVTIHMMSPQMGMIDATTDANGLYKYEDLPLNSNFLTSNFGGGSEYYLFTDQVVNPTGTTTGFFGKPEPTPILATSTDVHLRNFSLTATSSAVSLDIKLTASADTFAAGEQIDVFLGGPGQFVPTTVTPGTGALSAATIVTVSVPQQDGIWWAGIGPAMPKGGSFGFSGPPPETSWMMPEPIEVVIIGCPTSCAAKIKNETVTSVSFTINVANKTITGVLKDESGQTISDAEVFAYSPTLHTGNHALTSAVGVFSIKVIAGLYNVGAFSPTLGHSREVTVVVDSSGNVFTDSSPTASTGSSGANPFVLKLTTPAYTIKGRVTDGTNAVGNSPVFAYRTDGPGFADTVTDSSTGNYTLRVDNGTWKVNVFIPGFGQMTERTVVITGASQTDIDFSPSSTADYSILSGRIYEDLTGGTANQFDAGEGVEGAVIRVSGASGTNESLSGDDGSYSVRVTSGTGYQISDIFEPSYGRIAPLKDDGTAIGTIDLTASTTQNIRVATRQTVTINFKDSNGDPLQVQQAFVDLFDTTTTMGNHIEVTEATTTSVKIANGASTTIRAFIHGVPPANVSVASDDAGTLVLSGVLQVNGNEIIKITINTATAAMSSVSGTAYKTSATAGNELEDVWIQFVDQTNGVHFGTSASTSGAYLLKIADGTYTVFANKPGFVSSPVTVTVSGTTTQNFVLTQASLTISGTITVNSAATEDAYVWAHKVGGGDAISTTDNTGAYTLYVTSGDWKVFAAAEGFAETAYGSNPVSVGSSALTGININLTTADATTIDSNLSTSNTFTDTAAGSFKNTTLNVEVELDSGALGSAGNSAYITAKETGNYPRTSSVNIVADEAMDISAFSGGSKVSNLEAGKTATVELIYTKAELATDGIDTTSEVANLTVVSYSETLKEWETLSTIETYLDSSGNVVTSPASDLSNVATVAFTAVGDHFSAYALSSPTDGSAPSTPTGVAASAGAKLSNQITISWGSVSGATGYFIYRDTSSGGTFPLLADAGNVTSYTDTGATSGTTFHYKVSAYKSSGTSESSASSAVSATVEKGGGGGVVGVTTGGGGGGGAVTVTPPPPSPTIVTQTPTAETVAAPVGEVVPTPTPTPRVGEAAQPSPVAQMVSPVFNQALRRGMSHADVKRLQQLLNFEPDTQVAATGAGSPGNETNFFGAATEKALQKFQAKHGLASSGSPQTTGYGALGPKTRVKLEEVFSRVTPRAPEAAQPSPVAQMVSPVFNQALRRGMSHADVKRLQQLLNSDPDTQIAASGAGSSGSESDYFGPATERAVKKFQEKYGIAKQGDAGYGNVGPMTRSKLKEMFAGEAAASSLIPPPAAPGADNTRADLEAQLRQALDRLRELQGELQNAR